MFEKCLNPDCGLPFDYREGRLIRVSSPDVKSPAGPIRIEHFWLCGKCSERYVFPHEREAGMKVRLRVGESQETEVRDSAATLIPHVIVLEPGLVIFNIYNGYWFLGRPTIEELRQDLRTVLKKCRPDWDITRPEVKATWERGEHEHFYPYGKT